MTSNVQASEDKSKISGISRSDFGKTKDGEEVHLYELRNAHGMVAKVTNYGATLTQLLVADRNG